MYNSKMPSQDELPSSKQLIRSTILSIIVAGVLLLAVVLPAEYAIDPTGAGRFLGLTDMGEIKVQLEAEALADREQQIRAVSGETTQASASLAKDSQSIADVEQVVEERTVETVKQEQASVPVVQPWRDEVTFTLSPGEGTEYKLTMEEGAKAQFSWISEGGPVNYDTHGNGSGQSISYEKGRGVPEQEGELIAAFNGKHGWFFRNRNKQDVVLILRTRGEYGELKRML